MSSSSSSAALIHGSPSTPPQSQSQRQQHSHQPPPPPQFRVLYMTEEMVVVDKPHGVPMDGAHHPSTVEKWIQGQMQSDIEDAAREDAAALIINKKEGAKCGDDTIAAEDEVVVPTPSSICVDNTNHYSHNNVVMVTGEEGGGGIGAQRMPRGYFTTPLPQGNRHTSSRGNAGPSVKQLKFVHQLDAPTSGLLCLAFSRDVAARLGHCFQMRKSVKVYSAVLFGWVGEEDVVGGKTTQTSYNPPPLLASSTPTPSPPSNNSSPFVFEGIPTPLNDYLASTPHFPPNTSNTNTTTLLEENGSRMPLLKPLSPFAALYEESTTPTSSGNINNNYNNSSCNINADDVAPPSSSLSVSPAHHQIHIEAPIGNDPTDGSTLMTIGGTNPRDASSLLQVVKRGYVTLPPSLCNGKDATVGTSKNATGGGGGTVVKATHVLLRLYTGRRHQLRLHCRHIGHPIVGDASYVSEIPQNAKIDANDDNDNLENMSHPLPPVLAERMYLHAWRLAFFDSFEVGEHGKRERVEARKKRRRESLGISASGGNGDLGGAAEVTGVSTGPDPFAHLVVSNSPQ